MNASVTGAAANLPPRGALRLVADPTFGGLFWGKLFATAGMFVHSIVAAIVVFEATSSALMVGLVTVAQFAPQLFLAPLSGSWADRGHAASQIMVGRILCLAGSGSLALWMWLTPGTTRNSDAIAVLLASTVVGLGFVVGGPALNSIVPSLVRPGELATAVALNTAPSTAGRIGGPVLGSFVAADQGPAAGFGIAAAGHLIFVVILIVIRLPAPAAHRGGVDYSIKGVLQHVRRDRPLLLQLLAIAMIGFAAEPSLTLAPALADDLGGGAHLVGHLSAAFGAGAALGLGLLSTIAQRLASATASATGLWLLAAGLLAVAVSPSAWIALAAFVVVGIGFSAAMSGVSTLIQERAPDELRGRIMALWMVGFVGSRPIAAALVGLAADAWSVETAFISTAVLMALAAALCRPRALVGSADGIGR